MNTITALGFEEKGEDLLVTYLSPFYGKKNRKRIYLVFTCN